MLILVTGGARSGKSTFAESLASHYYANGYYIATAIPFDGEMKHRILKHQSDRQNTDFSWQTIEEPYQLVKVVEDISTNENMVILVDCLTIWLSNMLLLSEDEESIKLDNVIDQFVLQITEQSKYKNIILVTNEVGSGIVPENRLARMFRDYAGRLNQKLAIYADFVFLVASGIPIDIKALRFPFHENSLQRNQI